MPENFLVYLEPQIISASPTQGVRLANASGGTLSYGSTSACADGTISTGSARTLTSPTYIKSASVSRVSMTLLGSPDVPDGSISAVDLEAGVVPINVLDYGAVGDSTTDDQPAIQSALDDADAAGGGIVYLPVGDYALGASLTISDHVILRGEGFGASGLFVGNPHPTQRGTMLSYDTSVTNDYPLIQNADRVGGNVGIEIHDILFSVDAIDADVAIIDFLTCWNTLIRRVHMMGSATLADQPTSRVGLKFFSCEETDVENVYLVYFGVYGNGANALNIRNSYVGGGIRIVDASYPQVTGTQVWQDFIANGTAWAAFPWTIWLDTVTEGVVSGNETASARQDSIFLENCDHCKITDNGFKNSSAEVDGTFAGIYLDGNAGDCEFNVIENNTVSDNQGSPRTGYGLRLYQENGGNCRDNLIANNVFSDYTSGASINFNGFPANNIVRGNLDEDAITVASAATVTLPASAELVYISGTADITSVAASWEQRRVTLIFTGTAATNGLVDGSNLKLAGNLAYTADDTITLVCDGTNWYETGRSVN